MIAPAHLECGILGQRLAGLGQFHLARKDQPGEHQRLRPRAAFREAARHQQLVEAQFRAGAFGLGGGHLLSQTVTGPAGVAASPASFHRDAMKANRVAPLAQTALAASLLLFTASCSGRREAVPAPLPSPAPRPAPPSPPPPQPPQAIDWRDMPQTPGTWRWSMEGSRSVARFGGPDAAGALVLSCNREAGAVTLIRPGVGEGQVPMTILTSTGNRTLSAEAVAGPPPAIALTLAARDSLLDAMAFSRGRFAVETTGLPTLYLPSWAEVSRVVEDCR